MGKKGGFLKGPGRHVKKVQKGWKCGRKRGKRFPQLERRSINQEK